MEEKITKTLKEEVTKTPVFPVLTFAGKFIAFASTQEPTDLNFFGKYLIVSGLLDLGEVIYRVYIQDEPGLRKGNNEQYGKPYSCFEKHIYDGLKWVGKKTGIVKPKKDLSDKV